ncbi:hypothetical protein DsansV1_C27g0203631 [Dioscorea sansibarensis]
MPSGFIIIAGGESIVLARASSATNLQHLESWSNAEMGVLIRIKFCVTAQLGWNYFKETILESGGDFKMKLIMSGGYLTEIRIWYLSMFLMSSTM